VIETGKQNYFCRANLLKWENPNTLKFIFIKWTVSTVARRSLRKQMWYNRKALRLRQLAETEGEGGE